MQDPSLRTIALSGALTCVIALAVAHGSETFAELVPCALCLWERWPYRIGAICGIAAALMPARHAKTLIWLMILSFASAAGLAFVHAGVEFGWWPSPLPECSAGRLSAGGSIADRLAAMPARPSKPCDEPVFLIPGLPLSMAAMNFLFALTLTALFSAVIVRRTRRR